MHSIIDSIIYRSYKVFKYSSLTRKNKISCKNNKRKTCELIFCLICLVL